MKRIKLKNMDLIVYDFDGVMTNNKVLVAEDGKESVFCNRADGLAVTKIKRMGIPQIILSTEKSMIVDRRAKKLKIKAIHGVEDKKSRLVNYCKRKDYDLKKVIYVGNDINDLEVMKIVGYALAPRDAHRKVKSISRMIIPRDGGEGVIKEFFENILDVV